MAQEAEDIAVHCVRAASGYDVDHTARRAAELRHVVAYDELELLHCLLRDRGAYAVDGIIHRVGAVHRDLVGAGALAAEVEPARGRRADRGRAVALHLGRSEGEVDVVPAVDGQIVDAQPVDCLCHRGAGRLDQLRGFGHGHAFLAALQLHVRVEFGRLANRQHDLGVR